MSPDDFAAPELLYVFGIAPSRVDILNRVKGFSFAKLWQQRTMVEIDDIRVPFVSIDDLVKMKKLAGRPQDRLDLAKLKKSLQAAERGRR